MSGSSTQNFLRGGGTAARGKTTAFATHQALTDKKARLKNDLHPHFDYATQHFPPRENKKLLLKPHYHNRVNQKSKPYA